MPTIKSFDVPADGEWHRRVVPGRIVKVIYGRREPDDGREAIDVLAECSGLLIYTRLFRAVGTDEEYPEGCRYVDTAENPATGDRWHVIERSVPDEGQR